jgi:hypothetical protein
MHIVFTNKFKSIMYDVTTVAIRICLMVYVVTFISFICLEFHITLTLVLTKSIYIFCISEWFCCFWGVYFIINYLVYFIDWNIITLKGRSTIMTLFFD